MYLKNLSTGVVSNEREMVISWEMDTVYDYLNSDDYDEEKGPQPFLDWLKEMLESGEYELYVDSTLMPYRTNQ